MADLSIQLNGLSDAIRALDGFLSPESMRGLMREIGINVRERTADHIAMASVTRHKTADGLGAEHSKFLEFAPGRGQMTAGSAYIPKKGEEEHRSEVRNVGTESVEIVIANTPGLQRAFGPMTITPRRARALTIPINAVSYAKTVAELRDEGHQIFRVPGTEILAETINEEGDIRPLYALKRRVTIPQDRELLPSSRDIEDWAYDTSDAYLEILVAKAGG